MIADKDAEWEASLESKSAWLNRPAQPPGLLRSGARPLCALCSPSVLYSPDLTAPRSCPTCCAPVRAPALRASLPEQVPPVWPCLLQAGLLRWLR